MNTEPFSAMRPIRMGLAVWVPVLLLACAPLAASAASAAGIATVAGAAEMRLPGVSVSFGGGPPQEEVASALKIVFSLTLLSLAPAILMAMTSFTRIIIVLSMMRHAIGMPETPPNAVLINLALFLTLFTMLPVLTQVNEQAIQPFNAGKLGTQAALDAGIKPVREFMLRQTREQDLSLMVELAHTDAPPSRDAVSLLHLVPAFMLSELKSAFQIGFMVFLPFLLIDLIVSSVLMGMGMMMVSPAMIALPLKVLMFVLIDGWNLVVRSLVGSFV